LDARGFGTAHQPQIDGMPPSHDPRSGSASSGGLDSSLMSSSEVHRRALRGGGGNRTAGPVPDEPRTLRGNRGLTNHACPIGLLCFGRGGHFLWSSAGPGFTTPGQTESRRRIGQPRTFATATQPLAADFRSACATDVS
jgi:hypothetical protein